MNSTCCTCTFGSVSFAGCADDFADDAFGDFDANGCVPAPAPDIAAVVIVFAESAVCVCLTSDSAGASLSWISLGGFSGRAVIRRVAE